MRRGLVAVFAAHSQGWMCSPKSDPDDALGAVFGDPTAAVDGVAVGGSDGAGAFGQVDDKGAVLVSGHAGEVGQCRCPLEVWSEWSAVRTMQFLKIGLITSGVLGSYIGLGRRTMPRVDIERTLRRLDQRIATDDTSRKVNDGPG